MGGLSREYIAEFQEMYDRVDNAVQEVFGIYAKSVAVSGARGHVQYWDMDDETITVYWKKYRRYGVDSGTFVFSIDHLVDPSLAEAAVKVAEGVKE